MNKFFRVRSNSSNLLLILIFLTLLEGCSSGKSAYKHGDYYDAVLESVQRLRSSPTHKKSIDVLTLSYQAAVDFLTSDAQNQIASDANQKWRQVVGDYNKINNLYENIRTCPGALKVIPNPVSKYQEIKDAKQNAAEESYNAGVQAMLKNTREDAKQAFFLFTDANNYSPGYRESIEMIQQAKFNATIKVVVLPSQPGNVNWVFEPVVYNTKVNQFVQFYSPQQAEEQKLAKVDHYIKINVNGYMEGRPSVNRTSQNYTDSVTTGEKMVNNQKVAIRQAIKASSTIFEKQIAYNGSLQLLIQDATSNAEINNSNIGSNLVWNDRWAYCSGDTRAIPSGIRNLCGKTELYPNPGQLMSQTKNALDSKLSYALQNFYRNF